MDSLPQGMVDVTDSVGIPQTDMTGQTFATTPDGSPVSMFPEGIEERWQAAQTGPAHGPVTILPPTRGVDWWTFLAGLTIGGLAASVAMILWR